MTLARAAWLTVVIVCTIACAILLLEGFNGYAGVVGAVGLAAAINLR